MTIETSRPVRVRFAPSPTGSLHIGGLRTALFNWLFARHYNGKFILRIEDTDQKRFDPNALHTLVEALRWAGLDWDEGPEVGGDFGPYVQSERLASYGKWATWLIEHGHAYKCFCTSERLERVNREKQERKEQPGYDRFCRNLTPAEITEREAQNLSYVVRFRMPLEGVTVVPDAVRGDITFENAGLQDAVMLKSDGFPTYHFAHVVDDYEMQISHVMRANEWLPSAPLHVALWHAFGWEVPVYMHLPVMLNPNGKGKMSKRNPPKDEKGNIIPVMVHDYMEAGYLPEAVTNFLANTGWNFGDEREIFSMAEAIERFDGTGIQSANSAFPVSKLEWLNGEHLRALTPEELARRLQGVLEKAGLDVRADILLKLTPLVQVRMKSLNDVLTIARFLFIAPSEFAAAPAAQVVQKGMDADSAKAVLQTALERLSVLTDFTPASQEAAMRSLAEELSIKPAALFNMLRVATTAQQVAPPLFESMEILGKSESLRRVGLTLAGM